MYPAVVALFPTFSAKFEGRLPWMYLDRLGLVTTGIGNKIDPITDAFGLGWRKPDNTLASPDDIRTAWEAVKFRQDLNGKGGGNIIFQRLTDIRLTNSDIDTLVQRKLDSLEGELSNLFPNWNQLPADAQLGILSMAWAMGAERLHDFPLFRAAIERGDFTEAAKQSHIDNPSDDKFLEMRNDANRHLFLNSAEVLEGGFNPETVFYPGSPSQPAFGPDHPTSPQTPNAKRGSGKVFFTLLLLAGSTYWFMKK